MIASLAALVIAHQDTASLSPAKLVSKMIALYRKADNLSGQVRLTVATPDEYSELMMRIQYEKPSKLYILQQTKNEGWLVVSDGKTFSYLPPEDFSNKRQYEPVWQHGVPLDTWDIYGITRKTLKDRSAVPDILIGKIEHLQADKGHWVTMEDGGTAEIRGQKVRIIKGKWRDRPAIPAQGIPADPVSGSYEIAINDKAEMLQYKLSFLLSIQANPQAAPTVPVPVTSTWELDVHTNQGVDQSLFTLP